VKEIPGRWFDIYRILGNRESKVNGSNKGMRRYNLNLKAKITLLMAALLIGVFGISALAACPPGEIDISDVANWGPGLPISAAGNIQQAGTYCVPNTGYTIGVNGPGEARLTVTVDDVTIRGESATATLTGDGAATSIIQVNAVQNVAIQNLAIRAAAGALDEGVDVQAGSRNVRVLGVLFLDGGTGFGTYAAQLSNDDTLIQGCTFDMTGAAVPVVNLLAGRSARILDNEVNGVGGSPSFFVANRAGLVYDGITVTNNTINRCDVFVDGGGNGFSNGAITDNRATCDSNGLSLDTATNMDVTGNEITYAVGVTPGIGLQDGAGSNNEYSGNRIVAGGAAAAADDAILFLSNNTVIRGNTIIAALGGTAINCTDHAAAAVLGVTGASNAVIEDNVIRSAGDAGILMDDPANTNFVVRRNQISDVGDVTAAGGIVNIDPDVAGSGGGTNHLFEDNVLNNITGLGISSNGNNTIRGNSITNVSDRANAVVADGIFAGANDVVEDNEVNTVTDTGVAVSAYGISLNGANTTLTGNTVNGVFGGWDGIGVLVGNQTITNNEVRNVTTGFGIWILAVNNNTVINNQIESTGLSGILLNASNNNTVRDNTIDQAATQATVAAPQAAIRIIGGSSNNTIQDNVITDAGSGTVCLGIEVVGAGSDFNKIRGNTVSAFTAAGTNTSVGIRVLDGQGNEVLENEVSNSGTMKRGIAVSTVNEVPITDNTIEGMTEAGLVLNGGNPTRPLLVQGNTLTGNVAGILFLGSSAKVTDVNRISGGAEALKVPAGSNAAGFEVNGNCITDAAILARNEGFGTLDVSGNYWSPAPNPGVNIFGSVDYSDPLPTCPGDPITGKTHTYGAADGWYMVSVPLNSGSASSLFGTTAYTYNPATGEYDVAATIDPAKGYWVMLPASKSVTDTGDQVTSDVTLAIATAGWHQISAPWSYPKSAIQVTQAGVTKSWTDAAAAGWVRDDIYGYVATDGAYTTPSTMNPWYGYWVRAEVSGLSLKLLVASGTPVSTAYAPMNAPMAFAPTDLPPMPPTFTPSAATLSFGNSPNPVVDVNTTYFEVKGAAAYLVEALKVQIYDLSGRLVYEAEEAGASLAWHTDNTGGEYLANGVYLYKLYALLDGQWVVSKVKNVVILR